MKTPLFMIGALVLLTVLFAVTGPFLWGDGADGVKHPCEQKANWTWREEAGPQSYRNMEYYWETKPELRPLIEQAMSDGRLTTMEALDIYNADQRNGLLSVMEEKTE